MRWLFALCIMANTAMSGVHVVDGDTLDIDGERIRLHGIDAPEKAQSCKTPQGGTWACGTAATEGLKQMIARADLRCRGMERDAYGRLIAVCYDGSVDLNAQMVERGLAWAFTKYARDYVAQERRARDAGQGVWRAPSLPAWEFRTRAWQVAKQEAPKGCPIKGNISKSGKIYHPPWSPWYARTRISVAKGERWFCNEAEAQAAGWRAPA